MQQPEFVIVYVYIERALGAQTHVHDRLCPEQGGLDRVRFMDYLNANVHACFHHRSLGSRARA